MIILQVHILLPISAIIDMYTTSHSIFSLLPYGHLRIKLNRDLLILIPDDTIHTFNLDCFRGSVLGQYTSEPSLALVNPGKT